MPKPIKIKIPLSSEDLQNLQNGERFSWRFDSLTSKHAVDVALHLSDNFEE